jgi:hypothetical protein
MTDPQNHTASRPQSRPTSIVVAAGLVLCMGAFLCAAVAIPTVLILLLDPRSLAEALTRNVEASPSAAGWLSTHFLAVSAFEVVLGAASVGCGVGLWIGRPWARRASQVAMGVLAVYWVTIGGIKGFTHEFSGDLASGPARLLVGAAIVGISAVWAAAAALPIWLLRRPDATRWLQGAA